ncbi:serine/threonine protein kinase [Oculatella sp. LEGE 06141]|uniref:serine/threonine-protein kinase n=1 Tax=Oculatella sp. LEGE 06141 TaxID=1828648 RepID=UPI00187FE0F4|nr:serine/threonine-protein kinase [Oculatella sp. LEGE 06141]MBE9177286.1 serine/threonine protein kinase [Oculatella sp. LEGE 06141]
MSHCLNPTCQKPANPDPARFCQNCGSRLLLGDRYRALRPIGGGNSSRTFLGQDTRQLLDPRRVIKQFSNQDENAFRQEVARLDELAAHPQIPELYDYFERDRRQYLVQEFVDGQTLLQQMQDDGVFDEAQIVQVLQDLLPLLQFLHDRHLIHRDVKPANLIRRSSDQRLMLVDFGAVKQVTASALKKTGTVIGSAEYTAPEQLMGKAEFASDLYSVGVSCIHLLTGVRPFELFNSADSTWLWRVVSVPVSDRLAHLLDKLLQNTVSQRYQSARAVLQDLARFVPSVVPMPMTQPPKPSRFQATANRSLPRWTCSETWNIGTEVNAIAFTPAGETLVCAGGSGAIQVWDVQRQVVRSTLAGHDQAITAIALTPDGTQIASGSWDHTIKLWQLATGEFIGTLKGHAAIVTAVAVSPDGRTLASSSRDNTVRLWDLQANARLLAVLSTSTSAVETLAVPLASTASHMDSAILASGNADGTVQIWHLGTKERLRSLPNHGAAVSAAAIVADPGTIITSSWDMTVQQRSLHTGRLLGSFTGHLLPVNAIAINATGELMATGSPDSTIKLWDLTQAQPNAKAIATLTEHMAAIETLAFSPTEPLLASGSRDGTVRLWRQVNG